MCCSHKGVLLWLKWYSFGSPFGKRATNGSWLWWPTHLIQIQQAQKATEKCSLESGSKKVQPVCFFLPSISTMQPSFRVSWIRAPLGSWLLLRLYVGHNRLQTWRHCTRVFTKSDFPFNVPACLQSLAYQCGEYGEYPSNASPNAGSLLRVHHDSRNGIKICQLNYISLNFAQPLCALWMYPQWDAANNWPAGNL